MEAVAGEVAALRQAFPGSVAWGVSKRQWLSLSRRRGYSIHPRGQWLFRGAVALAQKRYDIQHLFGSLGDWFHLRALSRRPAILTVALEQKPCDAALLAKIDRFVVEWPAARESLLSLGIEEHRIRDILPGVDLERFQPQPPPAEKFTVLFASSPEQASALAARGVPLLLDAAALCPEFHFVLLWRPWGNSLPALKEMVPARGLQNVELRVGRVADMARCYAACHVTVAPFTDLTSTKPMPNSVIEGFACGRPTVVTSRVGLAPLVGQANAGVVCAESGEAVADALRTLSKDWQRYAANSRALAEREFSLARFVQSYRELYDEVLAQ
jgi:glycosyltransferase involved in cell wall biosynthesis